MSFPLTLNGSVYIIPTPNEVGWGTNLDDFFVGIAAGVLQKTGGSFTLSAETDFGASFGLKSLYYKSRTSNVASTGVLRLANNSDAISWRNAANSADLPLAVNSSNQLLFNGVALVASTMTPNRAVVSDGAGSISPSVTTGTEISYVSGVTSAIQTQLNNKQYNLLVVPVEQYGAVGDGVTDDITAIRAAITAISAAGGGTVVFAKNYAIGNSIYLPSNVQLRGLGISSSSILAKSGTFPADTALIYNAQSNGTLYTTGSPGQGASIIDIKLDCTGMPAASGVGTGQGVGIFNMTNFTALRVHVLGSQGYGFHLAADDGTFGLINTIIAYCIVEDCGKHATQDSIGGGNTSGSIFSFNWIKNPNGTAIDNVHVDDALWIGNRSTGASGHNGQIWSDFGMQRSKIVNNYIENGSIHVYGYLAPALRGSPSNVLISGNYIENGGSSAIFVAAANQISGDTGVCRGITVTNNRINGCVDRGVVLLDCPGAIVSNNGIYHWDTGLAGVAAIALQGGPNTSIGSTGCVVSSNTGEILTTTLYYAEETGVQTNNNSVFGNNFPNGTVSLSTFSPVSSFILETPSTIKKAVTITPTTDQLILGTTRTVTINALQPATISRTWVIPDLSGDMTFVALEGIQRMTGTLTHVSGGIKFEVDGGSNAIALTTPTLAANRIYSLPDAGASATFLLSGWGQIVNADISATAAISLSKLAALTTSRALQTNASTGFIEVSSVTNTELGYLSGVTSALQTQINTKASTASPTFTGIITIPDGSSAAPSLVLTTATTTGLYKSNTNELGIASNGSGVVAINSSDGMYPITTAVYKIGKSGQVWTEVWTAALRNTAGVSVNGTNTNDSAAAGNVGEYVSSSITTNTNFPTSGNLDDLTSISLTAGDWDVSGLIYATLNGSVTTEFRIGISTTSGNSATGLSLGDSYLSALAPTSVADTGQTIPTVRISLSGTTTVYLKYIAFYSAGTPQAKGTIRARRAR